MNNKSFWFMMLILSVVFFIVTIFSNNINLLLLSLALALIVRIWGNKVLFKDFYQKRLEKVKHLTSLVAKKEVDK